MRAGLRVAYFASFDIFVNLYQYCYWSLEMSGPWKNSKIFCCTVVDFCIKSRATIFRFDINLCGDPYANCIRPKL